MNSQGDNVECRNCGSSGVITSTRGAVAPFFLKRVHGIELTPLSQSLETYIAQIRVRPLRTTLRLTILLFKCNRLFRKLLNFRGRVEAKIRVCKTCSFVGPHHKYSEQELSPLYVDYRTRSYNEERVRFEPEYALLQNEIGTSEAEVCSRLQRVGEILEKHVDARLIDEVLDWGGADGMFVPKSLTAKRVAVLDVSSVPLRNPAFRRINHVAPGDYFDYIQLCHILEHVGSPHALLTRAVAHLNDGGIIYLEVPQDWSDQDLEALLEDGGARVHQIHEHLNLYSVRALSELAKSVGLQELHVSKTRMDFKSHHSEIVSGLFRKKT